MQCECSKRNATLVVFQIKSKGGVRAGPSVPRSFLAFWWAFRSTSCATSSYTPVFGDLLLLPTFPLRDWLRTNPDRVDFSATSQSGLPHGHAMSKDAAGLLRQRSRVIQACTDLNLPHRGFSQACTRACTIRSSCTSLQIRSQCISRGSDRDRCGILFATIHRSSHHVFKLRVRCLQNEKIG